MNKITIFSFLLLFVSYGNSLVISKDFSQSFALAYSTEIKARTQYNITNNFSFALVAHPLVISTINVHTDFTYQKNIINKMNIVGTGFGLGLNYKIKNIDLASSYSYIYTIPFSPYYLLNFSGKYKINRNLSIGTFINYRNSNVIISGNPSSVNEYHKFSEPFSIGFSLNHLIKNPTDKEKTIHNIVSSSGALGLLLYGLFFML